MDGRWAAIDAATVDVTTQWAMGLGYNKGAPDEVLIGLFDVPRRHDFSLGFLYRRDVPSRVLDAAIGHPDRIVRFLAAEGGNLTPAQWDRLAAATPTEKDRAIVAELRDEVATREPWATKGRGIERPPHPDAAPPASPAEIAEWADAVEDISPDAHSKALWWVAALHDNPDAMRQLAASPKASVRRSVARARHLPPDVVDRLAHDEDRVVHLFLTESCDDATPEVLLSVWSWWPGSLSFPGRPRNHPNFPQDGLLRFADDPNPSLRLLALTDKASTPELVDRFAEDPELQVRQAAAADPRMSPGPLIRLLLELHTAQSAAQNPAIPVPVMHHMVELTQRAPVPQPSPPHIFQK
ncbi:hypothetical protein ABIA31_007700 [Catenulispora sp. MAP5-51]|uniref:hypothetical protein n=1 Tax=Catenulispora sp. MAP5-51 TaxID=3156298 RepID=UPI0035127744